MSEGIGAGKGHFARQHLVEHHAERVDVAAGIAALSFDLFGRNVVGRAHGRRELGEGDAAGAGVGGDAEIDELDVVVGVDHDVFGLQVAMHHAVRVNVVEGIEDAQRDADGALRRQLPLFAEDLPKQPALDPLHDHVNLAAVVVGEDLHHPGMVHQLADFFLAAETIEESRVALHFGMGDLDGNRPAVVEIGGAEDGGHAAAGSEAIDAVVIELVAGVKDSHRE